MRARTSSSSSAASSSRSSSLAREADGVLGLPAREADRERARPRCAAAMRSRVGNAHASPTWSPNRSISRLRIATAEKSETCCAVIDVTSASNGSGAAAGGSRRAAPTIGASTGSRGRPARRTASRSNSAPSSFSTTGRVSSSSGSTSTPPGAARCAPRARRRRGAGRRRARGSPGRCRTRGTVRSRARSRTAQESAAATSCERLEALVRDALLVEVLREAGAREHAVGGERRAAVGPAVADEDERPLVGQRAALALVAAHRADALVAEDHAPAVRRDGSASFERTSSSTPSRSSTGRISCGRPLETITGW